MQNALGLTVAQVQRLDTIFNRDLHRRVELNRKIRRLDGELLRAIGKDDKTVAVRLIAEVETLRRTQNTRRSQMLLEMYRTLSPHQRARLRALAAP